MAKAPEATKEAVKVLVVEDSPTQLEELRFLLEESGFSVVAATNGKEGLAAAKANTLDLVVSDIVMPEMDGHALCKALRADEALRHLPVILLTSLADPRDVIRGLESGANNFICKPYDGRALLARVQNVLANQEIRKAAPSEMGISIFFAGQRFFITADRLQILDLLLSTYENAVSRNAELIHARDELRLLNEQLEARVAERTAALTAEIEERKQAGDRQRLTSDVLALLNHPAGATDVIRDIVQAVKRSTGVEAAGIRLKEGDDFPYYETNGFPDHFVKMERYLCARDEAGKILRDTQGTPVLECLCGSVLCGRTNPKSPSCTDGGSFWSNCTTEFLASITEEDRQARLRNRCSGEGYESVALIPLRAGGEIVGLLQLNDRRRNQFTPEKVRFLEGLGASIGIALARKRDEETIRESEVRYHRLFESAKDGILILDAETGKIVDVNPFLTELLAFPKEALLGRPIWETGLSSDVMAGRRRFAELQQKEYIRYDDLPMETSDRRRIEVEFVSNSYRAGGRKVIQCNIRDISERKRADGERRKLEEQLRVSQKMEAIGGLAGGVAHDFNNLLSVILSYTGCALDGVREGDPLKDDLLEVKKAGERAATLTRQLLAFSRKQVLQPVPLNLNQTVAGVEKMLRRIVGEDIDFVQVLASDLGVVRADPGQVEQVLMNLVVNARDAMPEGGKLTIETANVDLDEEYAACHVGVTPGPYVQLTVTDTGCGMDEQIKARLFEPFFTTKEKGKGTGLGLSTVHGIVKQSGGSIWVYSEPGRGTSFKIHLPRDLAATATATRPRAVPQRSTGAETILLVEDEEALRKVARRILHAAGYTVLTAADGDEALLTCAQHTGDIHLLLTDVVMPRMGGRALAQELSKTRPTLKVLYMSGYTHNAIVHHGVLDPETHLIGKPFNAADLTRKVREVLDEGSTNLADGHDQAGEDDGAKKEQRLDKDALRALPPDVLARLRKAVVAARYDEIVELVETVRIREPDVAAGLRRRADLFDYDGLRDLLSL